MVSLTSENKEFLSKFAFGVFVTCVCMLFIAFSAFFN